MKVFFLTGSLNQGGAEYQILALANLFKENGHEVEVFALTDYNFYASLIKNYRLKYSCLSNDQPKLKRVYLAAKKIRESKPDVIISYLKIVSQVAIAARVISGIKAKLIVGERTSLIRPRHDHYYFNLLLLADIVTVNSISKLNHLKKKFPLLKNKLYFVPNIIDIQKFSPNVIRVHKTIENKIGFVGRVSPEKNVLALVQATIQLINDGNNLSLELYGDTKNRTYYKKVVEQIEKASTNAHISMKGPLNDVVTAYKNIDLLCLISSFEGLSNVLAEALACGIPIIASDIEENRFLVEDGINGFLVNPNKIDDIAKGIQKFLDLNRTAKENMRRENRRKAERIFNRESTYKEYLRILDIYK